MGYTKDALKGVSWLGIFRITTRLLSYFKIAVIARVLTPAEYGATDIALMILSLSEILTETGINIFLIQEKDDIDHFINTAWVVSIFRGLIISIAIICSAFFISVFFHSALSYKLLLIVSLVPLLRGLINPSVAKFIKDLNFSREFIYRTSIFTVESIAAVLIVLYYKSPIAIVLSLVIGAAFEVILSFFLAKPTPVFYFEKKLFREILKRGKWLTATGIFNYFYHNGDNLVIGRLLGPASLGIYSRAYSISMLPITEFTDIISRVSFPVYVKISDDLPRLKRAYLRTILVVGIMASFVGAIFFYFPEFIVNLILGPKWLIAAPVLKVLALFAVLRSIIVTSIAPLYAVKRQDIVTKITFISFSGLALTIIPSVTRWGLIGAAYAVFFGTILSVPVIVYYITKLFFSNK